MDPENNTSDKKRRYCKLLSMRIKALFARKIKPVVETCARVLSKDRKLPTRIIVNTLKAKVASVRLETWFSIRNFIVQQEKSLISDEFTQILSEKMEKVAKILSEYHYRPFLQKLGLHKRSSDHKISVVSISKLCKNHNNHILLYSFHRMKQYLTKSRLYQAPLGILSDIIELKISVTKLQAFTSIRQNRENQQLYQLTSCIKKQVDLMNEKTASNQKSIQTEKKKLQNLKGQIGNQTYLKNQRKAECRRIVQTQRTRSLQLIRTRDQELKQLLQKQSELKKAINVLETIDNDICSRKEGMKAHLQTFLSDISNSRRMYGIEELTHKFSLPQNSQADQEHEQLERKYALLSAKIKAYEQTQWLSPPEYKALEQKNQAVKKAISALVSGILKSQIIRDD